MDYGRPAAGTDPDYREIVGRIGDMIYTLDRAGRFTCLNSAGLQLVGYDADELLGRHLATVLTSRCGLIGGDGG